MPQLPPPDYRPPWPLRNRHLHTVYPTLFRRGNPPPYRRQRVELPDGDFIDLDWLRAGHDRVALLCHGLEGCSHSTYMRGMSRALHAAGWDVACFNFRGCSGEPNRLPRMYHSGATDDLRQIVETLVHAEQYTDLSLVGFSLGGNLLLKYLGERGEDLPDALRSAVALSVPIDLGASADELLKCHNRIYALRFLRLLKRKIAIKHVQHPQQIPIEGLDQIHDLIEFDDRYTAPLHGFDSARDYYRRCSSRYFLQGIRRPTLILSALDDPFLTPECFPRQAATDNPWLYLQTPSYGGHVGFVSPRLRAPFWSEQQTIDFFQQHSVDGAVTTAGAKALHQR